MKTPCTYCGKPLASEVPKWATSAYHGECRLIRLRDLYAKATSEDEMHRIMVEAKVIKSHVIDTPILSGSP